MLSDELQRAETTSGAVWRAVKVVWEPVGHKILSHLRFFPANLQALLRMIHPGISTLLCTLHATIPPFQHSAISFCLHTFLTSFSMIDFCICLQRLWSSFHVIFPTLSMFHVSRSLKARIPAPQRNMLGLRPLLLILIIILSFSLLFVISSLPRREGLEPHMTPRRLRRLQRNVWYHLDSDL